MNKDFHQLAPLIALKFMPVNFQSFLICPTYTVEQLQIDADLPDLVDHDNIENDPLCRHAHSYKLSMNDGQLQLTDGDALERLVGLCEDAHDFHAEGKPDLVRYCLGKLTHYRIDLLTAPHLHHGKPWSDHHAKFEEEMGHFIVKHWDDIGTFEFTAYNDVFGDCRKTAEIMWSVGLDIVAKYENSIPLTDEEKLSVLRVCVQGIGDLWLTLAKELKF